MNAQIKIIPSTKRHTKYVGQVRISKECKPKMHPGWKFERINDRVIYMYSETETNEGYAHLGYDGRLTFTSTRLPDNVREHARSLFEAL